MWLALDGFDLDRNFQVFDNSQGSETTRLEIGNWRLMETTRTETGDRHETRRQIIPTGRLRLEIAAPETARLLTETGSRREGLWMTRSGRVARFEILKTSKMTLHPTVKLPRCENSRNVVISWLRSSLTDFPAQNLSLLEAIRLSLNSVEAGESVSRSFPFGFDAFGSIPRWRFGNVHPIFASRPLEYNSHPGVQDIGDPA